MALERFAQRRRSQRLRRRSLQGITVDHNSLVVELSLRAPKGAGTHREVVQKLGRGGLVGLLLRPEDGQELGEPKVFLGEVHEDVTWGPQSQEQRRGSVKVEFHDSAVFLNAVVHLGRQRRSHRSKSSMTFFEVPGLILATLTPFLKRLQTVEPSSIPFGQWIAQTTDASVALPPMEPPRFARSPTFQYDLSAFLQPGAPEEGLSMNATDSASIANARETLKAHSTFDDSQADAFIDTMTREVAMIQG